MWAPVPVSVAICGSECNTFLVDRTREGWFGEFQQAVKQALVDCGLCKEADSIALTDVRGNGIAQSVSVHELRSVGAVYPVINGSLRSIDTSISRTTIGAGATTPISHSVNKEFHLEDRIEEMCNAGCNMIVTELAKCKSLLDVQMAILPESDLEKQLNTLIEKHIEGLAEIHSDRAVADALKSKEISLKDFAGDMTDMLLKESAEFVGSNQERYVKYFKAREMADSNMIQGSLIGSSSNQRQSSPQTRSIYGTKTDMEIKEMQAIAAEYRTPDKIHSQVLGPALTQNEALGRKLVLVIKDGPQCHRRARHRRHKHGHKHGHESDDHHGHHHHHSSGGAVLAHGRDGSCKCHAVRGHQYERYFSASGARSEQRMIEMYRRSHRLKRLPPFPGVRSSSSSSSGRMQNYTRGGGSPGSGFWNKSDGGSTYGSGTVWRQGGERPGRSPPFGPAREPGLPGGVQASVATQVPEPVQDTIDEPETVNVAAVETPAEPPITTGGSTLKDLLRQTAAARKQQQQPQREPPFPQIAAAVPSVHKAPPTKLVAEPPSLEVVTVTASIRQTPAPARRPAAAATTEPPSLETASNPMDSRGDLPGVPNVDDMIARMSRSLGRPYGGK